MPFPVACIAAATQRRKGQNAASTLPEWAIAGGIAPASCKLCYQPKGAASLAESYVNLASPGAYNATPVSAPAFDADGWVFAGAQVLNTGYVLTDPTNTLVICQLSNATGNGAVFGISLDGELFNVRPTYLASRTRFYFWDENESVYTPVANGSAALSGGASFDEFYGRGFINGAFATNLGGAAFVGTLPLAIGAACNGEGSYELYCTADVAALALYNPIPTDVQIAAVAAAMALIGP